MSVGVRKPVQDQRREGRRCFVEIANENLV